MKKREFTEMRTQPLEKLTARVSELKAEIVKAQMPSLGKTEKNVKIAHKLRKEVSQILTIITEKKNAK